MLIRLGRAFANVSGAATLLFTFLILFVPRKESDQESLRFGWALLKSPLISSQTSERLWGVSCLVGFWLGAWMILIIRDLNQKRGGTAILSFWSSLGYGVLGTLAADLLGLTTSAWSTFIFCGVSGLLSSVYFSCSSRRPLGSRARLGLNSPASLVFFGSLLLVLGYKLFPLFLWVLIKKPGPTWDELSFWWTASADVSNLGFTKYLSTHNLASYDPGFPIFSQLILLPFRAFGFDSISPALGFLFGILGLTMFIDSASKVRQQRRLGACALLILLYFGLILAQPWTLSLWLQYLNGDAPATVALFAVFFAADPGRYEERLDTSRRLGILFKCVGIGVMARVIKPPFSTIGMPILFAWLLLEGALFVVGYRGGGRAFRIIRLGALCVGFAVAHLLWKASLAKAGLSVFYSVPSGALSKFNAAFLVETLVPFWLSGSRILLLSSAFIFSASLAVLSRRFLPQIGIAWALIGAVAALYATIWSNVELVSSGRYLSQGALAIVFYSAVLSGPQILARGEKLVTRFRLSMTRRRK